MAEIQVEDLRHVYSPGTPFERTAIEAVNLALPQGQFVGVIGHTGSGKSTFIQHLNALLLPSGGRVLSAGEDINRDKKSRRDIKWKVGLVFQYPEYQLFAETVYEDIAFGPRNMGLSVEQVDERVREAAGFVGVSELFERSPLELSGGQKRRIAVAGVIAMRPEVLVLDEPTAGLDPEGCAQIMANIRAYREKTGATVIIVSHDMDGAAALTERLLVFDKGRLVMDGPPEEIFSQPGRLTAMGLDVPRPTAIALALEARGVQLQGPVYTHEQLTNAILRAYRDKEGGRTPC